MEGTCFCILICILVYVDFFIEIYNSWNNGGGIHFRSEVDATRWPIRSGCWRGTTKWLWGWVKHTNSTLSFHISYSSSTLHPPLHTPHSKHRLHSSHSTSHSEPLPLYSAFKLKDQWRINLCRPFFHYSMIEVIFTISRILFLQTVQGGVKCTVHYGRIWWLKQLFKIVNKN